MLLYSAFSVKLPLLTHRTFTVVFHSCTVSPQSAARCLLVEVHVLDLRVAFTTGATMSFLDYVHCCRYILLIEGTGDNKVQERTTIQGFPLPSERVVRKVYLVSPLLRSCSPYASYPYYALFHNRVRPYLDCSLSHPYHPTSPFAKSHHMRPQP